MTEISHSYRERLQNGEPQFHARAAQKALELIGLDMPETSKERAGFEPSPEELVQFAETYFMLDEFMVLHPDMSKPEAARAMTLNPHPDTFKGDIPPFFYYGTFITGSRDDVSRRVKAGTTAEEVILPDAAMAVMWPGGFNKGPERTRQDVAIRHYRYVTERGYLSRDSQSYGDYANKRFDADKNAWPQIVPGPTARKISGDDSKGRDGLVGMLVFPGADTALGETDEALFDRLMAEEFVVEQSYQCRPVRVEKSDGSQAIALCFVPHLAQPPIAENLVPENDWRVYIAAHPERFQ